MHDNIKSLSHLLLSILSETLNTKPVFLNISGTMGPQSKCYISFYIGKKVKQSHNTIMEKQGKRRHSSYSFMTSALGGGEWLASRPGRALPPGKGPRVPIAQEAGHAPEPVWTQRLEEKSLASAGDRTSIARSSSP
jgi:hypothetical protein